MVVYPCTTKEGLINQTFLEDSLTHGPIAQPKIKIGGALDGLASYMTLVVESARTQANDPCDEQGCEGVRACMQTSRDSGHSASISHSTERLIHRSQQGMRAIIAHRTFAHAIHHVGQGKSGIDVVHY